jgi:hypothetical protein
MHMTFIPMRFSRNLEHIVSHIIGYNGTGIELSSLRVLSIAFSSALKGRERYPIVRAESITVIVAAAS